MTTFYEAQRVVWVDHLPLFFPERNSRFDVFDGDGTPLGVCTMVSGKGWFSVSDAGCTGPFPTRGGALRTLVSEDPTEQRHKKEPDYMGRIQSNKIIFEREVVLIQPHPLKGTKLSLNENRSNVGISPWTSVACAIVQTSICGAQHAVVSADDPNALFRPVEEADRLGFLPASRTELSAEVFGTFVSAYTSSMNNLDNIRALAVLIEQYAPRMRFVPEHLIPALKDGDRFLGRMFLRFDMAKYQAIVRFGNEESQQLKKSDLELIGMTPDDGDHLMSGWYGFHNLDRAVEMKIRAPVGMVMTIHAVSREYVTI